MSEDYECKHGLWHYYGHKLVSDVAAKVALAELDMRPGDASEFLIKETNFGFSVIIEKTDGETVQRQISLQMLDEAEHFLHESISSKQAVAHQEDGGGPSVDSGTGSPSHTLITPPGSKLLEWSRLIFPKKFVEGDITNTIHDMQHEYIESIAEDRKWHPKWVCVRGYMSYGVCVFCGIVGGVGKRIVDAWKGVNPS